MKTIFGGNPAVVLHPLINFATEMADRTPSLTKWVPVARKIKCQIEF